MHEFQMNEYQKGKPPENKGSPPRLWPMNRWHKFSCFSCATLQVIESNAHMLLQSAHFFVLCTLFNIVFLLSKQYYVPREGCLYDATFAFIFNLQFSAGLSIDLSAILFQCFQLVHVANPKQTE